MLQLRVLHYNFFFFIFSYHALPEVNEVNEEPPSFNEEDWIGKGLQYLKDKDAPLALKYYIDAIPDAVKDERTPSCNLTTT